METNERRPAKRRRRSQAKTFWVIMDFGEGTNQEGGLKREGKWGQTGQKWRNRKRQSEEKRRWTHDRWAEVEEDQYERGRGARKDFLFFIHAKRGCRMKLTVIQTDTYSRDETMSEQAWLDKNNHHTFWCGLQHLPRLLWDKTQSNVETSVVTTQDSICDWEQCMF